MSSQELKPSRTVDEVQREYTSLCTRAGHLQYSIDALTRDLALLNEELRKLNFEAAAIQAKSAEVPKPEEKKEESKS